MIADKLKKSLLQAAIQGKLTKQLPTDDNVDDLLKSIQEEKAKLIKEKKIKKQKPLPEITQEEIPFEIPANWRWVRLGNYSLNIFAGGDKPSKFSEEKTAYYTIPVIANGLKNNGIVGYTDIEKVNTHSITISGRGTIGYSKYRDYSFYPIVRLLIVNIVKNISGKYLEYVLNTLLEEGVGTSVKQLTVPMIYPKLIPIPPLAEQQRIVNKLNLLIAKLDELKHDEEKLSILNEKFPTQLKKSLLQAAIQGKLTEQLPTDDNVDDLLKSIQEEKAALIKEKKIKKQKPLPEIKQEEIPFEIPTNWRWVRLGEATLLNPRNKLDDTTVVSFIPMALIEDGYNNKHTSEKRLWKNVKSNFTHIKENDIGFAKITPCFQNRKSTIFHNLTNGYGAGTTELNIIRPLKNTILHKYIFWFLKTTYFIDGGVRSFAGTAGQQRINKDYTKNILLPLPPLAEQQRIVNKLDKLLAHLN